MTSDKDTSPSKVSVDEKTRPSVAEYSSEEVIGQFLALYSGMDFKTELAALDVSRLYPSRRKRVLREFQGLAIALWRLALLKSFPNDAERFFQEFLEKSPIMNTLDSSGEEMQLRVREYVELLEPKKDKDFFPVADYLADVLALSDDEVHRLRLKISLLMRTTYARIFEKLV